MIRFASGIGVALRMIALCVLHLAHLAKFCSSPLAIAFSCAEFVSKNRSTFCTLVAGSFAA